MKRFLLTFISLLSIQLFNAQTNYVWNGGTSTDWNTNTNWTPNGIPGAADNATIVTGGNNCVLAGNTSLTNLTITSGVLDLNTFTLNTSGVVACNGGNCNNGTFNSTATSLTFAGTTFGADITANVTDVYFNGSTFNGSVTVTKTGAGNDASSGNNNFNGTTSLTNAGTGYFLLTNSSSRTDNFNGPTTFNTSNTGNLWMAYNGTVNINNNITFNNTASSGNIYVGSSGSTNLASGNTLNCGTFSSGSLQFRNLTQAGTTAITLSPGNTGQVHIYKSTFTGSLTINAGIVSAQTSTFSAAVTYNLGGSILNTWSAGGNTYNGVLTVNNASSGYIGFANGTADVYNADVYANNTSTTGGRIIFGYNSTSQFNGDVYVNQSGVTSASGIALGWGGTYPVIQFAAGKKVIINGTFDSGYLQLYKTQQMDNTAMSITTTGTSAVYLTQNVFLGSLNVSTPDIYPYGGTYNGPVVFTKTGGGSSNHNNGNQNIFNSTLELNNQNGGGYLLLGYNSNDQFNDDITVTSIGSASGISFGWGGGTGTPVLAAGKTIQIGGAGYSSGYLQLGSFTQLGSTPINLTLTGTANFQVVKNSTTNPCVFGGDLTITSPDIYIQGGTFNGAVVLTKTGGTNNHNNGFQNIFNSTCIINQQSTTGYIMLGYNSNDLFNDDITVTNTGTGGIYLGFTSGTGSPTLASGKSIFIGGSGFSGGFLNLGYFTQLGSAPINLNLTGNAQLTLNNSTIGGAFTAVAPSFLTRNTAYSGDFTITKTGNTNDASAGGNTFTGITNVTNTGNGYILFGNGSPDVFNAAATFNNFGGNHLYVAYNSSNNIFNGVTTFNNAPSSNSFYTFVSPYSTGTLFNENIIVSNNGGSGVYFCSSNATATATLATGKTISIGAGGFNAGYLMLKQFTQLGATPQSLTTTGTSIIQFGPSSTFNGNVTSVSPRLYLNGCTFNGTVDCTKNGASDDQSLGNNVFNGSATITNSGSGYLMLGNGNKDQFNSSATFNNIGTSNLWVAYNSSNNIFNGVTTFNNAPTGNFYIQVSPYSTGTIFNENIIVSNDGGSGIYFCSSNATATATLATGKTISIGAGGFNAGYLMLKQFTQLGATPQSLTTTGTSIIQYGPGSSFGGNVTSVSPRLYFNGCTFNGTTNCTKNGATDDDSNGSNTFVGTSTITSTGSGRLMLGSGNTDAFMDDATFNNLGTNSMFVAHNSSNNTFGGITTFNNAPSSGNYAIYVSGYSAGTVFNDNIVVTSTSGAGVQFCYGNATATSTLATGKTITIGGAGFSAGYLMLKQFTQLGATPQALNVASGTSVLQLGPSSTFNGDVNFNFPRVLLHGTTYNGTATIQKNGATDDAGTGGNIFNGTTTITNSGSGYLLTGSTNADTFNGVTTFNNTGTNRFYFAHNHGTQTTVFNQPLTLNSNKSGGSDPYSFFICEGGNTHVNFNDDVTINNNGSIRSIFRFLQGTNSTAQYNGDLTINLSNTNATGSQILLGEVGNSTYNGNITLNSTTGVTSSGIYFNNGSTASSTLSVGNTISIGGSGFTSGTLSLRRFTQQGTTAQNLTQTSGTAILVSGTANEFNGPVTFNFPQLNLISSTYNNSATIQKNGATNNNCYGGNTFNGTTHIINSHSANYLLLANNVADTYNGNITLEQQTTGGILYPNYNTNCTYAGDVTVTSPASTAITFGSAGNGRATFNGGNAQAINLTAGSAIPVFTRLTLNKSANDVTLNTKIFISSNVNFTQGILNTTSTNILHVRDAATTNIGNSLSYVNGPMNYDMALNGSRTLTFPIGKSADWRPAVLNLTHNNSTSYTYNSEVFNSDSYLLGWSFPPTVSMSSHVHWWDITRTNTSTGVVTPSTHLSGNQTITLYYDANDGVTDPSNLTIIKNTSAAPTSWIDIGGTGATITSGSVSSTSSPTAFNSFSRFTLGNKVSGTNPLPIELLYFTATPVDNKVVNLDWATASEINNQQYDIERSIDGVNFEYLTTIKAYGNGNSVTKQVYKTVDEKPYMGISYYRLKQIDFSGEYKYAEMVSVNITGKSFINFYPNPAQDKLSYTASEDFNTATIKIMNSVGAIVLNESSLTSYNGSIDLSHLANGIYYLVINQSDKSETIKISIQR